MTGSVYDRVPMTPAIAALPRWGNMPVPYITKFLADDQDPQGPNPIAPGGLAIDCTCEFGVGRPVFGKQCVRRQRSAMIHRRCNVCGKRITGPAVFTGVAGLEGDGDVIVYSIEAPTCPPCLAYSALTCPKLATEAGRCRLVLLSGDYPIYDRWATGDHGADWTLAAHGQPRREVLPGRWEGALDFHAAVMQLDARKITTLAERMATAAPQPYRELWADPGLRAAPDPQPPTR